MGTRPSRVVFLLSFIIGVYAILNEYISGINWDFLSKTLGATNWILLMVAFLLLLAGVVFRKL